MTLIPLISAIVSAPEATTAVAGAAPPRRNSYDPGAGHRPVAFAFAVGLPVALVVAVALSPIIIEKAPVLAPLTGTLIEIEKPKPPRRSPRSSPAPEVIRRPTRCGRWSIHSPQPTAGSR